MTRTPNRSVDSASAQDANRNGIPPEDQRQLDRANALLLAGVRSTRLTPTERSERFVRMLEDAAMRGAVERLIVRQLRGADVSASEVLVITMAVYVREGVQRLEALVTRIAKFRRIDAYRATERARDVPRASARTTELVLEGRLDVPTGHGRSTEAEVADRDFLRLVDRLVDGSTEACREIWPLIRAGLTNAEIVEVCAAAGVEHAASSISTRRDDLMIEVRAMLTLLGEHAHPDKQATKLADAIVLAAEADHVGKPRRKGAPSRAQRLLDHLRIVATELGYRLSI